jgi:hypothetical protein
MEITMERFTIMAQALGEAQGIDVSSLLNDAHLDTDCPLSDEHESQITSELPSLLESNDQDDMCDTGSI